MYAYDLVILSTTQEGLQKCLDELYKYCIKWKLDVNIDKTKCMQFMKINKLHNQQFRFGDRTIKNVKESTYLGITFNGLTSFQPALKELSNKANRALFSPNSKYKLSKLPLDIAIKLFDVMISPILLYGSEVWGAYEYNSNQENLHKWDKSPIEAVHTQFLKRLLGVNRSTTNLMILAETGCYPLIIAIKSRILNFIKHIEKQGPTQLSYMTYTYEKQIFETKCGLQRPNIHKYFLNIKQKILENTPKFDNCDVSHTTVPNENFNIFNRSKTFLCKCLKQGYRKK